jgi:23S rRNA pseudouridine2605 synthase
MRLNRYLASAGLGSRRSCEDLIRTGRVTVNGKLVTDLATSVEDSDHVSVDGKKQKPDQPYTLAMFKPEGVLCSRDAQGRRRTVFDLLPEDSPRLFYVGRLDMDSEGLLILTNRGELAQQLTHPSFKLPKVYHVELDKDFDFALVPRFLKGFLIEPGYAQAEAVYKLGHNRVKVVLTQGLKRQIRLMFLKFGYRVKFLRRIEIGRLSLGNMKVGEWRFLDEHEIKKLLLAPAVREEAAPKTFGKPRELGKPESVPVIPKPLRREPVRRRPGRPVRAFNPQRPSGSARSGRPESSERPERSGRPQGSGRPSRPERSTRSTGSGRFSRPERSGIRSRPEAFERPDRPARPTRTTTPASSRFSRPTVSRLDRPKRLDRAETHDRSSRSERGSRPGPSAKGRPPRFDRSDSPRSLGRKEGSSGGARSSRPSFSRGSSRPVRPTGRSARPPRR